MYHCYIGAKCVVPIQRISHQCNNWQLLKIKNRMNATRGDANLHPGVNLLSGPNLHPVANCAHEHGFSQLIIQSIVCCTCPHFVWCVNLITRILKEKTKTHKQFGQSLYKLLLKGTVQVALTSASLMGVNAWCRQ